MKIFKIIFSILFSLLVFSCQKDNFDGPDASFYGKIVDQNGNLVPQDIIDGSVIMAYEQGFETPVAQKWFIMNSGEFRNDMVFSNEYEIRLENGNFFPIAERVKIKPGGNEHNFTVTPYITFTECSIEYDESLKRVKANFKIRPGDPQVKMSRMTLYVFTDMYVSANVNMNVKVTGMPNKNTGSVLVSSYPGNIQDLYIDVSDASVFRPGSNYYFRVGIQGIFDGVGTIKHNYSETQVIAIQ